MLRENVELLRKLDVDVKELISLGDGARSELWLQIKADVTGLPLRTLECEESTSLGVAVLAVVAVGLYPDVQTACQRMVRTGSRVEPNSTHRETYDAAYDTYGQLFESLQELFNR